MSNLEHNHLIGQLIHKLRRMEREPRTFGEAGELTPSEMHTIEAIGCGDGILMSELAKKLSITKGAATQIVSRLEREHFVHRQAHPLDLRSVVVSLKERGEIAFKAHEVMSKALTDTLREELGEEGYRSFERGISKFIESL
ncbi:MarR family transcriptional regulator [Paenibacillus sp. GSMTC-2017]|uniref:MarR family winged helix-turn-helix transcriptional regulator n=1 Tax=Paenibacillus sp. GSMTC-2017 TaxID=2794350 RepID=UPI0018D74F92|nr:MarR family transcriptional regulator [Paenibacillus sp. GSMTC-2017]MBH5319117.1 MarR family transcriptional regulator [Paenibacillus sp. GSMTC-2017]